MTRSFAATGVAELFFGDATGDAAEEQLETGMTVGDVTVAESQRLAWGDEVVAYRVTLPVTSGGSTVEFYAEPSWRSAQAERSPPG